MSQQRRQFAPPEDDRTFLDELGLEWEAVVEGGARRIVIYDYPVPAGYNHDKVALHLRLEPAYPDTQIDMVYVHPDLSRRDGKPIAALANEAFDNKTWQRWSRHRTAENPWVPGEDNIERHLLLVDNWLRSELAK
jgi:hypothetical protein